MPAPRRTTVAVLLGSGLLLAVAAPGSPAGAASSRTVVLEDIDFTPSRLAVATGTTVTWRWKDGTTRHDVRSTGTRRFKSSALKATGRHVVVFRKSGTYRYVCTVHPGMDGSVRVH